MNEKESALPNKDQEIRPFPSEEIYEGIKGAKKLAVIDRNLSAGWRHLAHELRASLYPERTGPGLWVQSQDYGEGHHSGAH